MHLILRISYPHGILNKIILGKGVLVSTLAGWAVLLFAISPKPTKNKKYPCLVFFCKVLNLVC